MGGHCTVLFFGAGGWLGVKVGVRDGGTLHCPLLWFRWVVKVGGDLLAHISLYYNAILPVCV